MPKSGSRLLVGSTVAYSGKSATILGMAKQLQAKGVDIAYGKPIGTSFSKNATGHTDEDVCFFAETLGLAENRIYQPLLFLDWITLQERMLADDRIDYPQRLAQSISTQSSELLLLEGPGTLEEGNLLGLSLQAVANIVDAQVLLVARFDELTIADSILAAKHQLGDRLLGVLINDLLPQHTSLAEQVLKPFLEAQGVAVFGLIPRDNILNSVSVGELVRELKAEILCRPDRMDLMVETMTIGAMNVNSALKYFQKGHNMAVVTGGDRTDLQLAALETSTQCLILTGHLPPDPAILSRAEDLEVPILSVDYDTLTTVEIIDRAFGHVRLHEPIKVQCIEQLMHQHFDLSRLMSKLGLEHSPATR